jgi:hypothetical protein
VTANPSLVLIVIVFPWVGSQPAKETRPACGASTGAPAAPPTSMPVWPRSRYSSPPNSKPRKTGPSAGQLQASAEAGASSTAAAITTTSVVLLVNIAEWRT